MRHLHSSKTAKKVTRGAAKIPAARSRVNGGKTLPRSGERSRLIKIARTAFRLGGED